MLDPLLPWLVPVVFLAGLIDAIAGGGGLLTVPAYLIAGLPPTQLLGTNKFVSTIGTLVSTTQYIRHGLMIWPVAIVGIPCALLGSALGAHWVAGLDQDIVRQIILIALPIAAVLTLLPKPQGHDDLEYHWRSPRLWIMIPFIGLTLGWYDGLFGPGTGSLLILALYGLGHLNFLHAAATGRLFNLMSNAGALLAFLYHGQVLFRLALPLALASMAGHYCGSHLAIRRGARLVRTMLVVTCSLLLGYLLWQQFGM